jgi:carbonic anhydrase/acetyltransferase-like protein (isoleucine patch superfamily)
MILSIADRVPELLGEHYVADNATVIGSVTLGRHASVWFNAVVRGDNDRIWVGDGSNIQDGAVLHTDPGFPLTLGRNVSVGHLAMLHGCTIGDGSLIGIKSVILNNAVVGKNCLIGANTLIAEGKQIPDNSLVVGSPGRIARTLGPSDIEELQAAAKHYVEKIALYRDTLSVCAPP